MRYKFTKEELDLIDTCFNGRAKWIAAHFGSTGGLQQADKIERLRRKVMARLKNG